MVYDYLIVGAGFSGAVFARMAADYGKTVLLLDKRNHIAGNSYDFINDDGIMIQKYGPHIFHTKIKRVWNFLSKYTKWNNYTHKVLVHLGDKEVYLPINLETMEKVYNRKFTPEKMKEFLSEKRINIDTIRNSKDVILSQVGEDLYELFFENYTKKQWGVYPDELEPSVLERIPVRFNRDIRYFEDSYQGIPRGGFTKLFKNLLDNDNIKIMLNTDYRDIGEEIKYKKIIYTGQIDSFFNYKFGKLSYRSLDFKFKTVNREYFQSEAVVNYPNKNDYTRITEFKYFYFQKSKKTTVCYEYPKEYGEPYYPIPMKENNELYLKYANESDKLKNIYFLGRLGQYRYINMDIAVENALMLFDKIEK